MNTEEMAVAIEAAAAPAPAAQVNEHPPNHRTQSSSRTPFTSPFLVYYSY